MMRHVTVRFMERAKRSCAAGKSSPKHSVVLTNSKLGMPYRVAEGSALGHSNVHSGSIDDL